MQRAEIRKKVHFLSWETNGDFQEENKILIPAKIFPFFRITVLYIIALEQSTTI